MMIRPTLLLTLTMIVVGWSDVPAQIAVDDNNVSATVIDRVLVLTGDSADNYLTFRNNRAGLPSLQGNRGTTINGQPRFRLSNLDIDGIEIDLGDGNDTVIFRGVSLEGGGTVALLRFRGGPGSDRFVCRGADDGSFFGGDVFLDGDEGRDRFDFSDYLVDGNAVVRTGEDDDRVKIVDCAVSDSLLIDTESGQGFIDIEVLGATLLSVFGGDQIDRFNLGGLAINTFGGFGPAGGTENGCFVFTGASRDLVSMDQVQGIGTVLDIDSGDGNDDVTLNQVALLDSPDPQPIRVACGAGNDTVIASNLLNINTFDGAVPSLGLIDGGPGSRDFLMIDADSQTAVNHENFELVSDGNEPAN